ncbi:hypothetical protein [Ancylobacter terrae]|uniref:hypothetical protein n=1 Tax=Ancylobacter sp. sgz301288 TaxID=3342077 RepID=UPI00385C3B8D
MFAGLFVRTFFHPLYKSGENVRQFVRHRSAEQGRAMSGTDLDESGLNPGEGRGIPKRVRHAVELKVTGAVTTWKAAAAKAGLTPEWLSKSLRKPQVAAFYTRRSREVLTDAGPEAVQTVMAIMRDGKTDKIKLEAAEVILRLNAMFPKSDTPVVNLAVTPGYVIDLSGGDGSHARIAASTGATEPIRQAGPRTIDLTPARSGDAACGDDDGGEA